jgi:hypothetical protein
LAEVRTSSTGEKDYYNNPSDNMEWDALIQEHPDDMVIHTLHALRDGLRFKLDKGDLNVSQATEIFENMRTALINRKEVDRKTFSTLIYLCWYIASYNIQLPVSER